MTRQAPAGTEEQQRAARRAALSPYSMHRHVQHAFADATAEQDALLATAFFSRHNTRTAHGTTDCGQQQVEAKACVPYSSAPAETNLVHSHNTNSNSSSDCLDKSFEDDSYSGFSPGQCGTQHQQQCKRQQPLIDSNALRSKPLQGLRFSPLVPVRRTEAK